MKQTLIRQAARIAPFKRQLKRLYYSRANPVFWWRLSRACGVLAFRFGLLDSLVRQGSITAAGEPLPWYSYPATEFLLQLDFSATSVFEYGSGNSSIFWSQRARKVFGPMSSYTTTTSVYFHRACALQPIADRQPTPGIGSMPNSFDEAWWKT